LRLEKISGVDDQVAGWIGNFIGGGWDVPLPVGIGIYRFEFPRLVEERLELQLAAKGSRTVRPIIVAANSPTLAFKPEELEIFTNVRISIPD
jgi:hypothetical protein